MHSVGGMESGRWQPIEQSNSYWNNAQTKRNFVMVFMETIRISVMVSIVCLFFSAG